MSVWSYLESKDGENEYWNIDQTEGDQQVFWIWSTHGKQHNQRLDNICHKKKDGRSYLPKDQLASAIGFICASVPHDYLILATFFDCVCYNFAAVKVNLLILVTTNAVFFK